MKKAFVLLFVLVFALPSFAKLKSKQIVGNWNYSVVTEEGNITGVFEFIEKDGKLSGNIITEEFTIPITKIELKEDNNLYLEIQTDNDLIKITVTIDGNKFKGMGYSRQGDAPITGEKQEQKN